MVTNLGDVRIMRRAAQRTVTTVDASGLDRAQLVALLDELDGPTIYAQTCDVLGYDPLAET